MIAGRAPASLGVVVRAVRPTPWWWSVRPRWRPCFDLERTTWLMRETGSGTRETCEALLASLDVEPPTLTLGSNGAVVAGAAAGLGATLVSGDAVRGLLAAGDLVEVPVPHTPMRRPWHAVTTRGPPRGRRCSSRTCWRRKARRRPGGALASPVERPAPAAPPRQASSVLASRASPAPLRRGLRRAELRSRRLRRAGYAAPVTPRRLLRAGDAAPVGRAGIGLWLKGITAGPGRPDRSGRSPRDGRPSARHVRPWCAAREHGGDRGAEAGREVTSRRPPISSARSAMVRSP